MTKRQGYLMIFLLFTANYLIFMTGYSNFTHSAVTAQKFRELQKSLDHLMDQKCVSVEPSHEVDLQ